MPFLEIKNIYKRYEKIPLLRDISFTVERGDVACLLGPSGGGKTTLLRILAGLEEPEQGGIMLEGQSLNDLPPHQRGIVLMFQDYALFPHRSVAENIAFGLKMRELPQQAIQTRVAEMLALVNLDTFGDRDVNELSGGERQRVALARSLAPAPRLLLLDEPLGALDRNLRERLLEELPMILHRVGVTAITVTHDQEEAFALADRVILLHEGQVVQVGAPEAVYDTPTSAWTARFLGLTNLIHATVRSQDPPRVDTPWGTLPLTGTPALPQPGTQGIVLVHPWGLHVGTPCPDPDTYIKLAPARVKRCTFHGPHYRLELTLEGEQLALTQEAFKSSIPHPGEQLTVWLDPAALRWLQATPN